MPQLIEKQPAFVLHTTPWRETGAMVELLTQDYGRIGMIARGLQSPKRHPLRAALQPLQHICVDIQFKGELAQLKHTEVLDNAPRLLGENLLASFYTHELIMRLLPRFDPVPQLYTDYQITRKKLATDISLAWTLRQFERDLLFSLGFGFDFNVDIEGHNIAPEIEYILNPDHGIQAVGTQNSTGFPPVNGRALLGLANNKQPIHADLIRLRRPLRAVLLHYLGGKELKSWRIRQQLNAQSHS